MCFVILSSATTSAYFAWNTTVAINGAANAAILAAKMLAITDTELRRKLVDYKEDLKEQVVAKDEKLNKIGYDAYLEQM